MVVLFAVLITVLVLGNSTNSFGTICLEDVDWPEKPCYLTMLGSTPTLPEIIQDWEKYSEYKGSDWMTEKKSEMLTAISNGELNSWFEEGIIVNEGTNFSNSHSNVYYYYFLLGEVSALEKIEGVNYADFPPPLKQLKSGKLEGQILCDFNLYLIFKSTNNQPACVKPSTYWKLLERGWVKDDSEKELAYQIHDVVAHVDLLSYSFDDEYGNMVVNVVEFLKNPKNASHLTIWGNFHEFEEYCSLHNCDHAIAYLYEDKNGIYHKGDFWEWIESDKPTILEKTIECYKTFHCDPPDQDTFSKCLDSKINGTTIKKICVNADISIDEGCVSVSYQDNVRVISCE